MKYTCPVCGWPELDEPPYSASGWGSFEICPCCGIEFGVAGVEAYFAGDDGAGEFDCESLTMVRSDLVLLHAQLQREWVVAGMKWRSKCRPAPENWNPVEQLGKLA